MPFKSEAQRRYLWWRAEQAKKNHTKPPVSIPELIEWQNLTGHKHLPAHVGGFNIYPPFKHAKKYHR